MADRRKRGAPLGLACAGRPSQRIRPASGRQELVRKMKAAAAVVVLVLSAAAVVTTVAAHASAKKTRAPIHEPRRLVWEDHAADLKKRKLFRRMYRMEEPVFNKLAGLLEPILQRNDYYASDNTDMHRERERERERERGRGRGCNRCTMPRTHAVVVCPSYL